MSAGRLASWLGPALLLAACSKGAPQGHGATASASASAARVPSAPASLDPSALPPPPAPPICRAIRVVGEARVGEIPLASGVALDGETWVSLAKGATVSLKHSTSGREFAISGPALFRACRRGREQVLLARGGVAAGIGMGSRPGAEVLIATPVASVHYGDADFTLSLDDKKLNVAVRAGQLEVEALTGPVKTTLTAREKVTVPLGKPDPKALMARCQEAAEAAEASARRVGDRSAPEPLGERAQQHVKARKAARNACTVAAAATGLVADPVASAGLWAEAVRWEGLWESIPRRGRAQAPEK